MTPRVGRPAQSFDLLDHTDTRLRLEDFRGRWLLLVFHRHLRWLPCRDHLAQLRRHHSELAKRAIDVVVVTFESKRFAQQYATDEGVQWPIMVDEDREQYHAYDMDHAGLWDVWGPRTWWAYAKAMARGGRPRLYRSDPDQRGGDVLIDAQGIVRLHWVGQGPADRPSIAEILRVRDAGA